MTLIIDDIINALHNLANLVLQAFHILLGLVTFVLNLAPNWFKPVVFLGLIFVVMNLLLVFWEFQTPSWMPIFQKGAWGHRIGQPEECRTAQQIIENSKVVTSISFSDDFKLRSCITSTASNNSDRCYCLAQFPAGVQPDWANQIYHNYSLFCDGQPNPNYYFGTNLCQYKVMNVNETGIMQSYYSYCLAKLDINKNNTALNSAIVKLEQCKNLGIDYLNPASIYSLTILFALGGFALDYYAKHRLLKVN